MRKLPEKSRSKHFLEQRFGEDQAKKSVVWFTIVML